MATPIKGDSGLFYVHDGAIYRPVACLTTNAISTTVSVISSNTKCNPGLTDKTAGIFDYNITGDGEYIDTTSVGGDTAKASHDYLLTKQRAKNAVTWKYDTGVMGAVYYGTAIISDLTLNQDAGDAISTFSVTLDGIGDIATVDPIV